MSSVRLQKNANDVFNQQSFKQRSFFTIQPTLLSAYATFLTVKLRMFRYHSLLRQKKGDDLVDHNVMVEAIQYVCVLVAKHN
jgi:hypothetical protein